MELPTVSHDIRDPERDVTYAVMAYRKLTREEVVVAVRTHQSNARRKDKKGSRITIVTLLGYERGL